MILWNLKKVFSNKFWIIGAFIWAVLMFLPVYFFTLKDSHEIKMWMWDEYYYFVLTMDILLLVLFSIFLWATIYKMKYFWNKNTSKIGFLWGLLWTLVSGCASCSITLASVLWLWAFVSFLPYGWIELKIFSIILLIYVCFTTLRDLEVCKFKIVSAKKIY